MYVPSQAIPHYRIGFSSSPKSATKEDYLSMGRLLASEGEIEEAKLYLNLALQLAPNFLEAQEELIHLKKSSFPK